MSYSNARLKTLRAYRRYYSNYKLYNPGNNTRTSLVSNYRPGDLIGNVITYNF